MPIPKYRLDDRNFDDLVKELVARIPSHTPEWTNPQVGDPGMTLIDLFAWLGDTLLYRVNLLPERQRLEFLRLLNIPMRPALAATGLVTLEVTSKERVTPVVVPQYTRIKGSVEFETTREITVMPFSGKVYIKRRPSEQEEEVVASIKEELEKVYDIGTGNAEQYITTPMFHDPDQTGAGLDVVKDTVDQSLWIALLAADEDPSLVERVRQSLNPDAHGFKMIQIGIEPRLKIPEFDQYVQQAVTMADYWQWDMPSSRNDDDDLAYTIPYLPLEIYDDTTDGFVKQGIVQLKLPSSTQICLPENNVDENIYAGTGNHPPRIDDEAVAKRLVTWIRLSPRQQSESLALDWVGINAVRIDQFKTVRNVILATADGTSDLTLPLPGTSVQESSFKLQVEEKGVGYKRWQSLPLHMAGRTDTVFELDSEAGTITFGDGLRGAVPEAGARIRLEQMRFGGGIKGNMGAGNLTDISHPDLGVVQAIPTRGGMDAETLDEAEKRIPSVLKHCDRAVTRDDYKQIASKTPGIELGRVEVLPQFKPQQKLFDIIGVMSVMVLPKGDSHRPPNPRPDRNILARVHHHVDERRPIGVELYVIGAEYIPLGLGVSVTLGEGVARQQTFQNIKTALYEFLWPLSPGGHGKTGWPLGRMVDNQELAVMVARVSGVLTVEGVNLFKQNSEKQWELVEGGTEQRMSLSAWQLPELLDVVVIEDEEPVTDLEEALGKQGSSLGDWDQTDTGKKIAIPVVPEICK
nr:putative baseplate assembly protein [uncultured Desulfobacter sp.]